MKKVHLIIFLLPSLSIGKPLVFADHETTINDFNKSSDICYVDQMNIEIKKINYEIKNTLNLDNKNINEIFLKHKSALKEGADCLSLASENKVKFIPSVVINDKVYRTNDVDAALRKYRMEK